MKKIFALLVLVSSIAFSDGSSMTMEQAELEREIRAEVISEIAKENRLKKRAELKAIIEREIRAEMAREQEKYEKYFNLIKGEN